MPCSRVGTIITLKDRAVSPIVGRFIACGPRVGKRTGEEKPKTASTTTCKNSRARSLHAQRRLVRRPVGANECANRAALSSDGGRLIWRNGFRIAAGVAEASRIWIERRPPAVGQTGLSPARSDADRRALGVVNIMIDAQRRAHVGWRRGCGRLSRRRAFLAGALSERRRGKPESRGQHNSRELSHLASPAIPACPSLDRSYAE